MVGREWIKDIMLCVLLRSLKLNSLGMVKTSKSLYVSRIEDGAVRVPFYVNHSGNGVEPDC